ncbi:telomerase RNA component interacting RNase-like [Glandiceps talaboti]
MADDERSDGGDNSGSNNNTSGKSNDDSPSNMNSFANDGSFMEMFKRKMEEESRRKEGVHPTDKEKLENTAVADAAKPSQGAPESSNSSAQSESGEPQNTKKRTGLSFFVGKRKGLKLKTGQVKKPKQTEEVDTSKKDPWSQYMAEVKKYKAHDCGDEDKTRPLVK